MGIMEVESQLKKQGKAKAPAVDPNSWLKTSPPPRFSSDPRVQAMYDALVDREKKGVSFISKNGSGVLGTVRDVLVRDVGNIVYGGGQSAADAALAVYGDARDTLSGNPTLKRSWKETKKSAAGVKDQAVAIGTDPWGTFKQGPVSTVLSVYGAGAVARGALARGGAVRAELKGRSPKTPGQFVSDMSSVDRKAHGAVANQAMQSSPSAPDPITTIDEVTLRRIENPSPQFRRVLDSDPVLAKAREDLLGRVDTQEVKIVAPSRTTRAREKASSKPGRLVRAAVRTPPPKDRTLIVPNDESRPVIAGDRVQWVSGGVPQFTEPLRIKRVVSRKQGDEVKQFAVFEGRKDFAPLDEVRRTDTGPVVINRVPSRSPLTRDIQGVIDWVTQRRIDAKGARNAAQAAVGVFPGEPSKARSFVNNTFSTDAVIGRESRSARKVQSDIDMGEIAGVERFGATTPAKLVSIASGGRVERTRLTPGSTKLSAGEQKAIDVASSGLDADPVASAMLHIQVEQRIIDEIDRLDNEIAAATDKALSRDLTKERSRYGRKADHEKQIVYLEAAIKHLADPSPSLATALERTRALSRQNELDKELPEDVTLERLGARALEIRSIIDGVESPKEAVARIQSYQYAQQLIKDAREAEREAVRNGRAAVRSAEREYRVATIAEEKAKNAYFHAATTRTPEERALLKEMNEVFRAADKAYANRRKGRDVKDAGDRLKGLIRRQEQLTTLMTDGYNKGIVSGGELARATAREKRLKDEYERIRERHEGFDKGVTDGEKLAFERERLKALFTEAENLGSAAARALEFKWQRAFVERSAADARITVAKRTLRENVDAINDALEAKLKARDGQVQVLRDAMVEEGRSVVENGGFFVPALSGFSLRNLAFPGGKNLTPTGVSSYNPTPVRWGYTGASERRGNKRTDVTALVADDAKMVARFRSIADGLDEVYKMSYPTAAQAGPYAVPIRPANMPAGFREALTKASDGTASARDIDVLSPQNVAEYLRYALPDPSTLTPDEVAGVRWVNPARLGGLRSQAQGLSPNILTSIVRGINAPIKFMAFYVTPKYAWNAVQSIVNVMLQAGLFVPANFRLLVSLTPDTRDLVFSTVGEGFSRSIGGRKARGATRATANAWNVITDKYQRGTAFIHEARRYGYTTDDQIRYLLTSDDKKVVATRNTVARRANRASIAYGEMAQWERALTDALFIYPWMRASFLYAIRFPFEHPVQAAIYTSMALQGREKQREAFGPNFGTDPAYRGLVSLGGNRAFSQGSMNSFLTVPEGLSVAQGLLSGNSPDKDALAGWLGPAIGGAAGLLGVGGRPGESPLMTAFSEVTGAAAPFSFYNRLTEDPSQSQDPEKQPVYRKTKTEAVKATALGRAWPTTVNLEALRARDDKAYEESLPAREKVDYRAEKALGEFEAAAKVLNKIGWLGSDKVPDEVLTALSWDRKKSLALLDYAEKNNLRASDVTGMRRVEALMQLLVAEKVLTDTEADGYMAQLSAVPASVAAQQFSSALSKVTGSETIAKFKRAAEAAYFETAKKP